MKKGSRTKKTAATELVRVSAAMLARLRAESLRSGIPLRELGDRALRAYLDRRSLLLKGTEELSK